MKKISLILLVVCSLLFVACKSNKPGDTVCRFLDNIQNEKYKEASELCYTNDETVAEETEALAMKMGAACKARGGIKSYEIEKEKILDGDTTAKVQVHIEYVDDIQDDEALSEEFFLRKVDENWMIEITVK